MDPIQPGEFDVGPVSLAGTFYPIRPGPVIIEFEQRSGVAATLSVIFFPVFGMSALTPMPVGASCPRRSMPELA